MSKPGTECPVCGDWVGEMTLTDKDELELHLAWHQLEALAKKEEKPE